MVSTMFRISITKGLARQILRETKFAGISCRLYSSAPAPATQQYNLVVIGGGSGGLACAKEAADLGKKVAVLDYVDPSPRGTKWGLGGTCVNVGCIPKKLMHQAATLGGAVRDAEKFGWDVTATPTISWDKLTENIHNHVKSLNWGHRVKLRDKKVDYINAMGYIKDPNTVQAFAKPDKAVLTATLETENIVIATGMRPRYPELPGARQYGITSDDIFWMKKPPGKTLCVGASYVSLECAGFLTSLGFDTTVMVRSTPLARFDSQMAQFVVKAMEEHGTKFFNKCVPTKLESDGSSGKIKVFWKKDDPSKPNEGMDTFDTVLFAIGRYANTSGIGLVEAGVRMDDSGYIVGNHQGDQERSTVPNIYAIGDVLMGQAELTPVATKAGKLLANRLFGGSHEQMDYSRIPSTFFTPLEYSFVGMSEDEAVVKRGADSIEIYHAFYKPLEFVVTQRSAENCYMKVITGHTPNGEILGLHYTGPNAGEVMQGYAVALRCNLTMQTLTSTIGIHPTCTEEFVKLHITKRSGVDPTVTGC